jgi:competence protein ComEC
MRLGALVFLAGIVVLQPLPALPSPYLSLVLLSLLLLFWWLPRMRLLAIFIAGLLWAWWRADLVLSQQLPPELEGKDVEVVGTVASVPEPSDTGVRFVFAIASLRYQGQLPQAPGRVRLSWYQDPPPLRAGDVWQLRVRLKRPRGLMNPGGFDYEAWLFQQRLRATGYVRAEGPNRRLIADPIGRPVDRARQRLAEEISTALAGRPYAGVVIALAIGEGYGIAAEQWQVLRDTGTIHLMAISGSHITLVAGLVLLLARRLWALPGRTVLLWPAPHAAAAAGLAAAAGYAALSGFSIPTQRALLMLAVVLIGLLLRRSVVSSHVLALALVLVLLLDPLGVLTPGFWLSFATVAIILYAMTGRLSLRGPWAKWGRIHWLVALGLLPLTLWLFQRNPWSGPVANLVAVPSIELGVVPVILGGCLLLLFSESAGSALLVLAERMVAALWLVLEWLAGWDPIQWAPVGWTVVPAAVGVAWMLSPRGLPARWLGMVWLLPLLLLRKPAPGPGELWLSLLDVGQGLAAVVRTQHRVVVYDTGPQFSPEFDAGAAAVVPFLREGGVSRIDVLVLSHRGSDHSGGAASVLAQLPVGRVLSGDQVPFGHPIEPCIGGQSWSWDGFRFEILHPAGAERAPGNNGSCVLRVSGPGGAILLPGDIERRGEAALLARGTSLQSRVLVAPHHGSRSSSTDRFVVAVRPEYVLFSMGHLNRYGFPHASVVERYRAAGSAMRDTASHGAITVKLSARGVTVATHRQSARRYWRTP